MSYQDPLESTDLLLDKIVQCKDQLQYFNSCFPIKVTRLELPRDVHCDSYACLLENDQTFIEEDSDDEVLCDDAIPLSKSVEEEEKDGFEDIDMQRSSPNPMNVC